MTVHPIEYIVSTPGICGGRPRIDGRRVTIENIAVLHNGEWSVEKIADELELEFAQIYAALAYYYSHKDEIDVSIHEADEFVRREGTSLKELFERVKSLSPLEQEFFTEQSGKVTLPVEVEFNSAADKSASSDVVTYEKRHVKLSFNSAADKSDSSTTEIKKAS